MKRIALGLATVAIVFTMSVVATGAFFSDSVVVEGNTFTTGAVTLGDLSGMPVAVTNLLPGEPQMKTVGIQYTGTTNGDIWVGNTGNSATPSDYLADVLNVKITVHNDPGSVYYNGPAEGLATAWGQIASDVSAGWLYFDITFTLSDTVGNEYAGKTNQNTVFLLYAVQTGEGAPTLPPVAQALTGDFQ